MIQGALMEEGLPAQRAGAAPCDVTPNVTLEMVMRKDGTWGAVASLLRSSEWEQGQACENNALQHVYSTACAG